MPQTLFATLRNHDEPIALPCFRIGFVLDGMLDQQANRDTAVAMLTLFHASFAGQLVFMTLGRAGGKPSKLKQFSEKTLQDWRALIAEGMPKNSGLRLYGTDQNELGVPFMPFFSLDHDRHPLTRIQMCVPWQYDRLLPFSDSLDAVARKASVRFGYQGFGFARSPISGLQDRWLPPAFRRFRSAVMGDVLGHEALLFYSKPYATMRRLDQQRRGGKAEKPWDYEPGVPDIGWRTYIGQAFMDRLTALAPSDITLDRTDSMMIVTAGPSPIWGDLNQSEDISAWKAVYGYLRPAFASQNILRAFTLDCNPADPTSVEVVEQYLNRFV
ncbi:MAG: hypothetical protein Q4G24_16135 [Paracoccus sp. (in: a-proteobacteria)]|uniref:hypothetical protein n=1 Tax=Paracoccus sp. TaxID=267 RepID=UPI0026E0B03D|nr:hypothetical protein [Paracoccus sp. (in: a-proteobacteria)]MDO5622976.1 hypothetical protein [Paracoccus sp. (in: a-proteobacteria)]